jgi:phage tail protein X
MWLRLCRAVYFSLKTRINISLQANPGLTDPVLEPVQLPANQSALAAETITTPVETKNGSSSDAQLHW